jgi:hypothetical protein
MLLIVMLVTAERKRGFFFGEVVPRTKSSSHFYGETVPEKTVSKYLSFFLKTNLKMEKLFSLLESVLKTSPKNGC